MLEAVGLGKLIPWFLRKVERLVGWGKEGWGRSFKEGEGIFPKGQQKKALTSGHFLGKKVFTLGVNL